MGWNLKFLGMDELLTLKAKIVIRVFIPMMMLRIVFFCISSKPTQHNSIMTQMMNARYKLSGKPVFKTCIFSTICNNCRLRGKRNCRHVAEMPWSDEKQLAKIEAIMENYQADLNREVYNLDDEPEVKPSFDPNDVEAMKESEDSLPNDAHFQYIYTGIDPAGGGQRSKYAIVSVVPLEVTLDENDDNDSMIFPEDIFLQNSDIRTDHNSQTRRAVKYLVVGVDYDESCRPNNYNDLLVNHIYKLQRHVKLEHAKVIIVAENNFGLEAGHIREKLERTPGINFDILYMDRGGIGIRMTNALKDAMIDELRVKLSKRLITIWNELVCARDHRVNGGGIRRHIQAEEARDELTSQLGSMRSIMYPPRDPTEKPIKKHTGKLDGGFDDLVDALMFTMVGHRYYIGDEHGAQARHMLAI